MSERQRVMTGGCQCGAVRYAFYAEPIRTSVCFCRMCQKALGSYEAPFTSVGLGDFAWTRGTPGSFHSSADVERHFCRDCGTPLSYRNHTAQHISLTVGSLDEPHRVRPQRQFVPEARPAFFGEIPTLPEVATASWMTPEVAKGVASRQHPDHDTDAWPAKPA